MVRYVDIWRPFVTAYEAGLWLFWVMDREVIAVPRPAMVIVDDRLHCETGPAVSWPGGAQYWFWRGVQVPERVIAEPQSITVDAINAELNAEVRRVMIERYGNERFIRDSGARLIHEDGFGRLWKRDLGGGDAFAVVEVVNSTAEPDGTFRRYWLSVPPETRTAREAVAWTFGLQPEEYSPEVET